MLETSDDEYDFDNFTNFRIGSAFEIVVLQDTEKNKRVNGGTIPVRKIFVNNVHPEMPTETIMSIFETYGKVFDVAYPRLPDGSRRTYIFITYISPEDASKAIACKQTLYKRYRFYIHPADQWHQPLELPNGEIQWFRGSQGYSNLMQQEQVAPEEELNMEDAAMSSGTSIHVLNDDCLVQIFSYLTKKQLIGIERVCKRWRDLSLSLWLKETNLDFKNVFVIDTCLYTDHFRELLLRCGDHITSLDISHKIKDLSADRTLQIISKHCKNLLHLNISQLEIKKGGLVCIAECVAPKLKSLYMDRCRALTDLMLAPVLKVATNLELFSAPRTGINGACLVNLSTNCKHLNIANCFQVKPEVLAQVLRQCNKLEVLKVDNIIGTTYEIIKPCGKDLSVLSVSKTKFSLSYEEEVPSFPNLTSLDLSGNFSVNDKMLSVLSSMCPQLEKIDLSACDSTLNSDALNPSGLSERGLQQLVKFPKLKFLKLNRLKCVTSDALIYLAVNCKNRIKKLECKGCHLITDSGPSRMVALCSELSSIDVSHCQEITAEFLKAALDSVKLRTNKIPLKVKVARTSIEPTEFQDQHPLLKVDFEQSENDWLHSYSFSLHSYSDDDDDDDERDNFLDELGFDSDWEAQSMFGDDIEIFEWYQNHGDWGIDHDYDDLDDFSEDDDDDDDDDDD